MDIQRLRNLTTGRLHTKMEHIYTDIEHLTGAEGVMTHQLPNALRALEPYLRDKVMDARFWDGEYDTTHTGEIDVPPMDEAEQKAMWERYGAMPSWLCKLADEDGTTRTQFMSEYPAGLRWNNVGEPPVHNYATFYYETIAQLVRIAGALAESCDKHRSYIYDTAIAAAVAAERERLRTLIADDACAITYQTMGQYRTALLQALRA